MRIDYFHTGGKGVEIFALDRVTVEPLPWPGNPARNVDTGEPGVYRYEVRDDGGQRLYARGFASIFGERVTTAEAAGAHRTFHESLRLPVPDGPVEVTVLRRREDQSFVRVWQTRIDPADPFVVRAPPAHQQLVAVEQHAEPTDKVDLLLIGDGYTADECSAKFPPDARRMAEALFRHEPATCRSTGPSRVTMPNAKFPPTA